METTIEQTERLENKLATQVLDTISEATAESYVVLESFSNLMEDTEKTLHIRTLEGAASNTFDKHVLLPVEDVNTEETLIVYEMLIDKLAPGMVVFTTDPQAWDAFIKYLEYLGVQDAFEPGILGIEQLEEDDRYYSSVIYRFTKIANITKNEESEHEDN